MRDPRTEPRVGDVLRRGSVLRKVDRVTDQSIMFQQSDDYGCGPESCWADKWYSWARDAQIVKQGETNDPN